MPAIGYNLGSVSLEVYDTVFQRTEGRNSDLLLQLNTLNAQNRDLQKLIDTLTHHKKDKKDANFAQDPEMRETIERIHALNPRILGATAETLREEDFLFKADDIETTLSLLDSTVKDQVTKVNETTMFMNQTFEDRLKYTESAQKTLEMLIRHIESIISKLRS